MLKAIKAWLPESVRRAVRKLRKPIEHARIRVRAAVNASRPIDGECNLCGYRGNFWPFGNPPRPGVACGNCDSLERHRLVGLWLDANPVDGLRVLHFAAEPSLSRLFQDGPAKYRTADLAPGYDLTLNIEDIDLPDESIDLVVCAHVLEHVDDGRALHEIRRILHPGGRAVLLFPIIEGWEHTYESPAHTTPEERAMYYGQSDHVRYYGRDVRGRITDAGFHVSEFTAEEPYVSRYRLLRGEKIFVATKPPCVSE